MSSKLVMSPQTSLLVVLENLLAASDPLQAELRASFLEHVTPSLKPVFISLSPVLYWLHWNCRLNTKLSVCFLELSLFSGLFTMGCYLSAYKLNQAVDALDLLLVVFNTDLSS